MCSAVRPWLTAIVLAGLGWSVQAQQPAPSTPPPKPAASPPASPPPQPAAAPTGVAATVNGQPITELSVQRGLKRIDPAQHAEARLEILSVLTDNILVDQYLQQLNIKAEAAEVEARFKQARADIDKAAASKPEGSFANILKELMLTEEELKTIIASELRVEKFCTQQATDKVLIDYFIANKEVFDGTLVRARHILIKPVDGTPQSLEKVKTELETLKQQLEKTAAETIAKQPANADPLAREQARVRALEDAFSAAAHEKSACPSKQQGGDVDWFPRAGSMVEPFARAAFALKPYQLSDVVQTAFGFHLILVTDRRPGRDIKYEDVKAEVREVYCERLRDQLCTQLRPKANIVFTKTAPTATQPK